MDAELRRPPPLPSSTTRLPAVLSLPALIAHAVTTWRLRHELDDGSTAPSGNPADEYRSVCEFMRLYATLRIYQLALLLGTTGSIVTALASAAFRVGLVRSELLRAGGLLVTLVLLLMDFRATSHWQRLRRRANELARALQYQPFLHASRWNPLTTSGAGFYLHGLVAALWLTSLFIRSPYGS